MENMLKIVAGCAVLVFLILWRKYLSVIVSISGIAFGLVVGFLIARKEGNQGAALVKETFQYGLVMGGAAIFFGFLIFGDLLNQ